MGTFPGFVYVVVTADGKVDANAQFEIENYERSTLYSYGR
jgi:hypothetical protein